MPADVSPRKLDAVERRRARLNEAREAPESEALEILRRGLSDRVQIVVARAAAIAAELELRALAPELEAAFERLRVDAVKSDKGCLGKTAILEALIRLEHASFAVYLDAIRHVQREPAWGGSVDAAAELRGLAAAGLVQSGHPEASLYLVDLLADGEKAARIGAARAFAQLGRYEGALVLRLALHHGDPELEVTAEVLQAYLEIAPPGESLPFIETLFGGTDTAVAETAAIALGGTRVPGAFLVLKAHWERSLQPSLRRALTVAMALLRSEEATEHLLVRISEERGASSKDALAALAPFLYSEEIRERVEGAVEASGDAALRKLYRESLPK